MSLKLRNGIHIEIKNIIKKICDEDEEMTPMQIHTRLLRNHRRNQYNFDAALIPTLVKVTHSIYLNLINLR